MTRRLTLDPFVRDITPWPRARRPARSRGHVQVHGDASSQRRPVRAASLQQGTLTGVHQTIQFAIKHSEKATSGENFGVAIANVRVPHDRVVGAIDGRRDFARDEFGSHAERERDDVIRLCRVFVSHDDARDDGSTSCRDRVRFASRLVLRADPGGDSVRQPGRVGVSAFARPGGVAFRERELFRSRR